MVKKLINDPLDVVRESMEGVVLTQPGTAILRDRTIVVRADRVSHGPTTDLPVALISGGGAGHEPAHAGYVASGMLTAAVSGAVFSSPSVDAVLDGIRAVTGTGGALLIVKSYTGDRLNFGLAAELARSEGYDVRMVVVGDDVALADDDDNAGRRGLAGTVLVHKSAGALAEQSGCLDDVAAVARAVAAAVGTMGLGLTPCIVPGSDEPGAEIAAEGAELGLGIHGEPGVLSIDMAPADELAARLVDTIVSDRQYGSGARVVALINSTGGTPPMELSIISRAVVKLLQDRGIEVDRLYQGLVMTSLEMAGCSVSLLATDTHDGLLDLLDAPTGSLSWPGHGVAQAPGLTQVDVPAGPELTDDEAGEGNATDEQCSAAIERACKALLDAEDELTQMDKVVGDGDLGTALARGARAWLADPVSGGAAHQLRALSGVVRREVGGTSGPLYAAGLLRAAEAVRAGGDWAAALRAGSEGVQELGGAAEGDRTMVDALAPAAAAAGDGLAAAQQAAHRGADGTADRVARRGRSSYLGDRVKGHPDPGAVAIAVWLDALGS
ncbi:dihydroxyacetone kinase family protein [Dermatophilaceae bacterium Sec6.4]